MIKEKKELKKSVATIHCLNKFSLLQRKISNALLFYAYPNLKSVEEHEISIKQLCEIIRYSGNNTEAIKNAIRGLITTLIEWNVVDEIGKEDWTASTILASVRLYEGKCIYAYSPRMRDLLFSPKIYGKINMVIQSKFKSSYGLALYENCIRYQGLPQTRWFDLDVFRKLMGVPNDQYQIFRDFNRRVLVKAVEEVNLHSNLKIVTDIRRKGRAVSAIRFKLEEKSDSVLSTKPKTSKDEPFMERLSQLFLESEKSLKEVINLYDIAYIQEKLNLMENSKAYKNGKIKNVVGYLLSSLKSDYKNVDSNNVVLFKKKQSISNISLDSQQDELKNNYNKYVMDYVETYINSLDAEKLFNLENDFKTNYLSSDSFANSREQKHGMKDHIVKSLFKTYIKNNCTLECLTYDEWLQRSD